MLQSLVKKHRLVHGASFPKKGTVVGGLLYHLMFICILYIPLAISLIDVNAGSRAPLRPFWIDLPSKGPVSIEIKNLGIPCET